MEFASKYVYQAKDIADEYEEIDVDDDLEDDDDCLWELETAPQAKSSGGILAGIGGFFGSTAAPQPSSDRTVSKKRQVERKKVRKADTNVLAISFKTLETEAKSVMTGDPQRCCYCNAFFSQNSKLLSCAEARSLKEKEKEKPAEAEEKQEQPPQQPKPTSIAIAQSPLMHDDQFSAVEKADEDDQIWRCEYCDTFQVVSMEEEEMPSDSTLDYILAPAPSLEAGSGSQAVSNAKKPLVVFAVDISGSMCTTQEVARGTKLPDAVVERMRKMREELMAFADGSLQTLPSESHGAQYVSRILAMQAAIDQQMRSLEREHPDYSVAVIAFNTDVRLLGDGKYSDVVIAGDKLNSWDALTAPENTLPEPRPVSDCRETLCNRVYDLEECGKTALGPALLLSIELTKRFGGRGSRVIMCTDGLANTGLGALDVSGSELKPLKEEAEKQALTQAQAQFQGQGEGEEYQDPTVAALTQARKYYERVGEEAKKHGIVVNVTSLKGDEARLEELGVVVQASGGEVEKVNPLELVETFSDALKDEIIATEVKCTILLHNMMYFRNEEGTVSLGASRVVRDMGNVTKESVVTCEFGVRESLRVKDIMLPPKLPFQCQIFHTKMDGTKCVRVISREQETTQKREEAEKAVNVAVVGVNAVQQSARVAQSGNYLRARLKSKKANRLLERAVTSRDDASATQMAQFQQYSTNAAPLYRGLNKAVLREKRRNIVMDKDKEGEGKGGGGGRARGGFVRADSDESAGEEEMLMEAEAEAEGMNMNAMCMGMDAAAAPASAMSFNLDSRAPSEERQKFAKKKAARKSRMQQRSVAREDDVSTTLWQSSRPKASKFF